MSEMFSGTQQPELAARVEPLEKQKRRYRLALAGAVVVLSVMNAVLFGFWVHERQVRSARMQQALRDVAILRDQAIAKPDNEQKWTLAASRIADVARTVDDAGQSQAIEHLASMQQEVQAGLEAVRRDRALLDAAANVRGRKHDLGHLGADAEYTRAFREAGLDIDGNSPEEIGTKLRTRPAVVDAAISALDDWALERRAAKQPLLRWRRPLEASGAADPNPFRNRVRAALLLTDVKNQETDLRALAADPAAVELSPASALLLAAALRERKAFEPAVELLRAVAGRHPDDVWVNYELADMLVALRPSARDEALRYFSAARAIRPETAHELAHLLETMGRVDEAMSVFADLIARRPHHAGNWTCYGDCLNIVGSPEAAATLARAVDEGQQAVRLKPDDALAHRNLGRAFRSLRRFEESAIEFRDALRLEPDDPATLAMLGSALSGQNKPDESIAAFRDALRVKPEYAEAHRYIGDVLQTQGKLDRAIAEYREAIRIKPDQGAYHVILGLAFYAQKKHQAAIAALRLAQKVDPTYAQAPCSLGYVLYQVGDYSGALAEARRAQEMMCQQAGKPYTPNEYIGIFERSVRLPAVLKGEDHPRDINETVGFADTAYQLRYYAAAAHFWEEALAAQPDLGEDRRMQHRYNAACAAVLAAAGQGIDKPAPDEDARARLRTQAVAWLKTELDAWDELLESGKLEDRESVAKALDHWLEDPDLASLRAPDSLVKLPEAERPNSRTLWVRVEFLLAKARRTTK
jgi:tetratricopeptide (TPR) repeat protein